MVGWVVNASRDALSRFRRRYKRRLYEEFNYFNVRGLTLLSAFTLDLTQVFVDLRVSSTAMSSSGLLRAFPPDAVDRTSLWDFLRFEQRSDRSRKALAITGPPGSGKTTLLQHVALTFSKNRQGAHRLRPMLPILLFVREHSYDIVKSDPTLGAVAEAHFTRAYWTLKPPKGWFERQLLKRRSIVLLDGLDEVADLEARQTVARWIDRQIANYPLARFLVTARPQGYRDSPLRRADVLEVMPFRPEQVERFVRQWYTANAVLAAGGRRTVPVVRRASNDADDLLRRLMATPALESMTVNPLLLTMITMVHKFRGALPGSRVELYDEICEVLLGRWRQAKGIDDYLKTEQKRLALQPLAAYMMEHKQREVSTDDALVVIAGVLERLGVDAVPRFLMYIQESSGLLQEKEAGIWTFAHLTFQEFLASAHWRKAGPPSEWSPYVTDSWWHETVRLYVAKGDATPVVEACIDNGGVSAFVLASECMDEAAEIALPIRKRAMEWLDTSLSGADIERRYLAAQVKLRRRLKSFQRITPSSDIYIDPQYLTNAEYEYFVHQVGRPRGDARQPIHWADPTTYLNPRLAPVEGLRVSDLTAFVAFAQSLDVGISRYRLPAPHEAEAVAPSEGGTLCIFSGGRAIAGISELEHDRLTRLIGSLHLADELPMPLPNLAELIVESDFRSYGTRFPYLRMADEALARALDADANEVILPACRVFFGEDAGGHVTSRDWAISTALKLARGRKKSLFMTGSLSRQLDGFLSALTHDDFKRAVDAAVVLGDDARVEDRRFRRVISELAAVGECETSVQADYAARHALARIVLYAYAGYDLTLRSFRRGLADDPEAGPTRALRVYWLLLIANERSRGTAISFDGVRLVRERVVGEP